LLSLIGLLYQARGAICPKEVENYKKKEIGIYVVEVGAV